MPISCDRVRDLAPGFVLGALEPWEMAAVRDHLSLCPEAHAELTEMGSVLPYIGEALQPVEPPRHLRTAVLAAVKAEMDARHAADRSAADGPAAAVAGPEPASPAADASTVASEPAGRIVSLTAVRRIRSHRAMVWGTRAAAVLVIVGLGGYAFAVQSDLNKAQENRDHATKVYNDGQVYGSKWAVLTPETGQKGGGVALMLPSGHVEISLHGLVATKGDEVYGVWLSADGKALTKSGTFTVDAQGEGYLELDSVPPSSSLWVLVCREANRDVAAPGTSVVTGTIWVYATPAPTPTR